MAMQGVLKLGDVPGECKIEGFGRWIDIKNFTWEISQKTSYQSGGGMAGGGRPDIQPFHFEKDADTTSAEIVKKCLSGTHFPKAELRLLKPGGMGSNPYLEFVKFIFTRVFITKVGITGSNDADAPGES